MCRRRQLPGRSKSGQDRSHDERHDFQEFTRRFVRSFTSHLSAGGGRGLGPLTIRRANRITAPAEWSMLLSVSDSSVRKSERKSPIDALGTPVWRPSVHISARTCKPVRLNGLGLSTNFLTR